MDRQTEELLLPNCGAKVVLYSYLTHGDFKQIQRKISQGVKYHVNPNAEEEKDRIQVDEIDAQAAFDTNDFKSSLLIKEILDSEGKKVTNQDDFIYNLSLSDGKLLEQTIDEIYQRSELTEEQVKK